MFARAHKSSSVNSNLTDHGSRDVLTSPGDNSYLLQIPFPPGTEEGLRQRAQANGQNVASYAARLLQEALNAPSVDELLAAFRKQVEDRRQRNHRR